MRRFTKTCLLFLFTRKFHRNEWETDVLRSRFVSATRMYDHRTSIWYFREVIFRFSQKARKKNKKEKPSLFLRNFLRTHTHTHRTWHILTVTVYWGSPFFFLINNNTFVSHNITTDSNYTIFSSWFFLWPARLSNIKGLSFLFFLIVKIIFISCHNYALRVTFLLALSSPI